MVSVRSNVTPHAATSGLRMKRVERRTTVQRATMPIAVSVKRCAGCRRRVDVRDTHIIVRAGRAEGSRTGEAKELCHPEQGGGLVGEGSLCADLKNPYPHCSG